MTGRISARNWISACSPCSTGKERTEAEFAALLARAGFRLDQVVDLGAGGECVIVASPGSAD